MNIDIEQARQHLKDAAASAFSSSNPDGLYNYSSYRHRRLFNMLMPDLCVLREKGFSFAQLATLLVQDGFNLDPSLVRSFFFEMLVDHLNKQILLLAEVRKETRGDEKDDVADRVAAIINRQRKEDIEFGLLNAGEPAIPVLTVDQPLVEKIVPAEPIQMQPSPPAAQSAAASPPGPIPAQFRCLPIQPGIDPILRRPAVPEEVYESDELMEHPVIKGLMLSKSERLYGAYLEYVNTNGEVTMETLQQRPFRVKWRPQIPITRSSTEGSFYKPDMSVFKNNGKRDGML